MAKTKEIQQRIKSINNTKKITRAMEMVSAAKMRRAIESVLQTREYSHLSWQTILNLANAINTDKALHPLLEERKEVNRVAVVLITSNRGLCGGFNSSILNEINSHAKKLQNLHNLRKEDIDFIAIGKKSSAINSRYGYRVVAEFPKEDAISEIREVSPIAKIVIDDFLAGKYDKVIAVYTDFVSAAKQKVAIKQILPIDTDDRDDGLASIEGDEKREVKKSPYMITFEPTPTEVLNEILPRLIEVQLFQALLESNASEHSARMAAMHQATEAANDLVKQLTLFYNKARQASITAEIAEISAGAEALAE